MKKLLALTVAMTVLGSAATAATTYPPCTAQRTDSCIQKQPGHAVKPAKHVLHRR